MTGAPGADAARQKATRRAAARRAAAGPAAAAGTIPGLFAAILADEPSLPALTGPDGVLTYQDWWRQSALAASVLAERGVRPGDVVGLLLPSGPSFAVWYLAVLRLGAVVSPINPRLGGTEIRHILDQAGARLTVTDTPARVPAPHAALPSAGPAAGPSALPAAGPAAERTPSVDGAFAAPDEHPAVLVWTSGTTGRPKGAWFDHGTLRFIGGHLGPLSAPYDRKLMPIPFAHSGYATRLYDQLAHRSALILTASAWNARDMLRVLTSERVTLGQGVPTQWEKLAALEELDGADLSALRLVATGASRVPPELVRTLRARLGCPVVVRYASTEVPLAFGTAPDDPEETVAVTVGRPLAGTEVQIRTAAGTPAAPGEVGRVYLRSPARMRGYWADPERTAAVLAPDGWLASSDLGHLDAGGCLAIVGRADDAYIRGGYNVYPSEVETVLAAHPGVARAAVVGVPAPVIGETGVAFVVRAPGHPVTAAALRQWCRDRIADYKAPDLVEFVTDLPVNATYKVDTLALRQLAAGLALAARPAAGLAARPAHRLAASRTACSPGEPKDVSSSQARLR